MGFVKGTEMWSSAGNLYCIKMHEVSSGVTDSLCQSFKLALPFARGEDACTGEETTLPVKYCFFQSKLAKPSLIKSYIYLPLRWFL